MPGGDEACRVWGWVGLVLPKTANACRYSVFFSILIFPGVKEPLAYVSPCFLGGRELSLS